MNGEHLRRALIKSKSIIKEFKTIALWAMAALIVCPPLPSLGGSQSFKTKRFVYVRQKTYDTQILKTVATLKPGAIVRIPDRIVERMEQKGLDTSKESVFLSWLKDNGELHQFIRNTGVMKKDYFIPVEVVQPNGSEGVKRGTLAYIPIVYLVEKQGLELMVQETADVIAKRDPEVKKQPEVKDIAKGLKQVSELEPPQKKQKPSALQTQWDYQTIPLSKYVGPNLRWVEKHTTKVVDRRKVVHKRKFDFTKNCPLSGEQLATEIFNISIRAHIPQEIIYSIMDMESSGNCLAEKSEYDGSKSIGLLQINSKSTKIEACNQWQKNQLRKKLTVDALKSPALQCLHNPIINIEEGVNVLRSKYATVNSRNQPSSSNWHKMETQARDDWRKALSAYSGGQAYIFQAFYDIQDYASRFGLELDSDNWETRRVFLLRSLLSEDLQKKFFRSKMKYKRHKSLVYLNLIYVEAIAGREVLPVFSQNSLVAGWVNKLYSPEIPMVIAENPQQVLPKWARSETKKLFD